MESSGPETVAPISVVAIPPAPDAGVSDLQVRLEALLAGGDERLVAAVDHLLAAGVAAEASDIHLEPFADRLRIRFRVEGRLHEAARLPKGDEEGLLTRLKVLARLVTYRKRIPQDGRIRLSCAGVERDLRLSFFPTIHGEKAVLRFLSGSRSLRGLGELGFSPDMLRKLTDRLEKLSGAVILTGPAGSGKTSTMYAALKHIRDLDSGERNIMTVEDPVEHALDGVNQCQTNPVAGVGFGQSLRSLLRQDPDVIMIGEVRDRETAELAVQAGLTGHLIITTLHSGTAPGVFTRLVNLEIEPYMVASSLTAVLAQRLVRRLCPACRVEAKPSRKLLAQFPASEIPAGAAFWKSGGCARCKRTGTSGRVGVFELLLVDDEVRELVLERAPARRVAAALKAKGHKDLLSDGLDKARDGTTSLEELVRLL